MPTAEQLLAEKIAVIARIRQYAEVMTTDKRMKVLGQILLREIERIEKEEAERTARGERA